MMRKTLSFLIAILLILSLATVTAGAAENEVMLISGGKTTEYSDYKEAFKAAQVGDTIMLLKDITLYGSESLTIGDGSDLTVDGNGFTIYSPYCCFYIPGSSQIRTKLTLKNLKIDCTQAAGKHAVWIRGYVDLFIENCDFKSSYDGILVDGVYNDVNVKDTSIFSEYRYGVRTGNCNTLYFENTKIQSSAGSCIEVMSGYTPAAEITLKNCDFTGDGNFCLWCQALTKVTIDGGTYTTYGNENKPAAIRIEGSGCDVTIKDGTFSCNQTSAISLNSPDNTSKLTIEGGTFNYTGGGAGSALIAGGIDPLTWKSTGGILSISGGTFVSNGTDAVVNVGNDKVDVTLTAATFTNSGSASVAAYSENGKVKVSFPAGQKTVVYPVAEPVTTPEQTQPVTTPEQTQPVTTPEQTVPETTPGQTEPVTTPEQTVPVTTPEQTKPETTPEPTEPETTTEPTEPETTPEPSESATAPEQTEPETTASSSGDKGCKSFAGAGFALLARLGAAWMTEKRR